MLQFLQTRGLPARQGESVRILRSVFDNFERGHAEQFLLIEIERVRAVLRNFTRQIGAQPVEHRHKVVDDHLDPAFGQVFDGLDVVGDILVAGRQAELDVLMDVDALDDLDLEAGVIDVFDIVPDHVKRPDLARGILVKHAHQAGAARDLFDLLEGYTVVAFSIPSECHFHFASTSVF